MKKALWLLVLALATGLIAAGCGDDDDDDGGDALSKEEFVAEGNRICEEGSAEIEAAAEDVFGEDQPSPEEQEAFITEDLVPNVQEQIDAIRDLGIPEGDEDRVNEILDDAEAALNELEENPSFEGGDPFAEVNKDLKAYGLTACTE